MSVKYILTFVVESEEEAALIARNANKGTPYWCDPREYKDLQEVKTWRSLGIEMGYAFGRYFKKSKDT